MSLLVVGVSHRSAPVPLLERVVLDQPGLVALISSLASGEHVSEAAVVSTCNRMEVYTEVDRFHAGVAEVTDQLAKHTGVSHEELTPYVYVHYDDRAVQQLFEVSAGLDSMVVGEGQILGQVRAGLVRAQENGTAGRALNELFQQALRVGKRARSETSIDSAGRSLLSVGLDVAAATLGDLSGRRAVVVGAGSMSSLAATLLRTRDVGSLVICNRTPERAQSLAASVDAVVVGLDRMPEMVHEADLVVSCTGALGTVIHRDVLAGTTAEHPVFVLDLALPRDVDPDVGGLPGVTVVDLEAMSAVLAEHSHSADVEAVRSIVAEEVATFLGWQRSSAVAPTVVALRSMAADVVESELARLSGRLPDLDEHSREEVARTVRRAVDKVLHAPTVKVKQLAEEPGGHTYAEALRELFGIDLGAVAAMTEAAVDEPKPGEAPGGEPR